MAPVMSWRESVCEMPRLMKAPRPPAPMYVAIAVMPMLMTTAMRTPAMITGTASGISTCRSRSSDDMPMPRAASRKAGSMLLMAVYVLRMIGNCEYSSTAITAGT